MHNVIQVILPKNGRARKNTPGHIVNPVTGCWEWQGSKTRHGYGLIGRNGTTTTAHRVYFEHFGGVIPEGWEVDHLCGNRGCVNPNHLESVTKHENTQRYFRLQMQLQLDIE